MSKPPKRKTLTPQEKKALSLQKDRRESHGRNDKASRKLVPLRKAQAQRRLRRADKQQIEAVLDDMDAAQTIAPSRAKPDFVKYEGKTLAEAIEQSALASRQREGRKKRTRAQEIEWFERFYGPAIAARMRVVYGKFGWIEE